MHRVAAPQRGTASARGIGILDRLVAEGTIAPNLYDEITIHAQRMQSTVEESIIQLGLMSESDLLKYVASIYRTRFVSSQRLARAAVDPSLLRKVSHKLAKRLMAFPILFDVKTRTLSVVAADITSDDVRQQMQFATGARDVKVYVAREGAIRAAIAKHYDKDNRPFELLLSGVGSREVSPTRRDSEPSVEWGTLRGQVFEDREGRLVRRRRKQSLQNQKVALEQEPQTAVPPHTTTQAPTQGTSLHAEAGDLFVAPAVYLETVNLLVTLIEQQHDDRRGHSSRVARLCRQLGERIRLTDPQVQAILIAAHLHDLGISSSSHVTPFAVAVDAERRSLARRTYLAPIRLLESVNLPEEALGTLKHRFERYDGTGFPERLSGKDIPLGARMLAVAESYVELTQSPRNPPKKKVGPEDACDALDDFKGTAFDPAVVDWLRHAVLGDDTKTQLITARYRALIVDPDPEETAVLEVRFTEQGYDVVIERSVDGALRFLDAEHFDIVISEVEFPVEDGFDLLQRMQGGEHKNVPLLFLTSHSDQSGVDRGLALGAMDYVVKPASPAVVAAKARRIIENASQRPAGGRGVSGSLQEMSLPDVIQILSNGRKSGLLKVRSGNLSGEMMFQDGSIHDARFGDLEAADAVYGILRLTEGDFALDPDVEPVADRIGLPAEMLLLEAMRRLDEEER